MYIHCIFIHCSYIKMAYQFKLIYWVIRCHKQTKLTYSNCFICLHYNQANNYTSYIYSWECTNINLWTKSIPIFMFTIDIQTNYFVNFLFFYFHVYNYVVIVRTKVSVQFSLPPDVVYHIPLLFPIPFVFPTTTNRSQHQIIQL